MRAGGGDFQRNPIRASGMRLAVARSWVTKRIVPCSSSSEFLAELGPASD